MNLERLTARTSARRFAAGLAPSLALGVVLLASLGLALTAPAALASEVAAIANTTETTETTETTAPATKSATVKPAAANLSTPTATVETFHAGLLQIMKDAEKLGFQGRIDKLAPLMGETFDLDFMASKTVGRTWKKLSKADKIRWAEMFTRFTTANYAGRFTGFTGEKFVTDGVEEAARGTQVVLTKIVIPNEDDVQLNYRLIQKNGEWRVIDVYLNGTVSELALRRSEYSSTLKRDGFEQLCASIETKIADLKNKGKADG